MRDTLRQLLRRYGLNRWLVPQPQQGSWTQASEILAIPALAAALAWLLSPADPLLTQAQFPWIWFAPVLVALRYGVTPGLTSCIPLVALWYAAKQADRVPADIGLEYFFGGGLLVLICGEYSDVWRDHNARMDETNVYLAERLSRITKRHLLLNLSHDRLEHEMLSRPASLRDALVRLRALTLQEDGRQPLPGADQLLQLLAQYVNLQSAALYTAQADGPQRWALGPEIARLGEPVPLRTDDELYELAQREQQLAHIAQQDLSLERSSEQLIVAPLLTSEGTPIGVLSVSHIPFFALHVENLQMLSVILSYYADLVHGGTQLRRLLAQLPTMPPQFAEELVRMQGLQARTGMASQILVMRFPQELGRSLPAEFAHIKRGLDVDWQTTIGTDTAIIVLMPLTNAAGMAGFMQRIQHWLQKRLRDPARVQSVQLQPIDFATDDPVAALQRVLQQG